MAGRKPIDDDRKRKAVTMNVSNKDLKILDNGVTRILSIANTKKILWLTIIMALLTFLGVFFVYKQVSTQL